MIVSRSKLNYADVRTKSERNMWWIYLLGYYHPRRKLHGYYPDYYNPLARVVVEVNGSIHDLPHKRLSDRIRTSRLRSKGIYVLNVSNRRADASSLLLGFDVIAATLIWPAIRFTIYLLRILRNVLL